MKNYIIKVMREKPNINIREEIMTFVYAVESDECAKLATERKERVQQVNEMVDGKVCNKKHKKRNCGYQV